MKLQWRLLQVQCDGTLGEPSEFEVTVEAHCGIQAHHKYHGGIDDSCWSDVAMWVFHFTLDW